MKMKKRTYKRMVGDAIFTYKSDIYNGEELDTEVWIRGECLCTIAGSEQQAFNLDMQNVVNKYKI